jgi:predicted CDP-diglyceride synthetase/phosphatidate cytidylyltransferase
MRVTRRVFRVAVPVAASVLMLASFTGTAQATIHPIVQSVNCAAAAAWANAPIADPPGQTPEGFTGDSISVAFPFLTVSFPTPLEFSQSDFRALIATGFIDDIVLDSDGNVTALIVDLRNVPNAASGQGGAHCANG